MPAILPVQALVVDTCPCLRSWPQCRLGMQRTGDARGMPFCGLPCAPPLTHGESMSFKAGSAAAAVAAVATASILMAPAASAADSAGNSIQPGYVCTSKHTQTTGSAKCSNLARFDQYRAKVTCIDSRGIKAVFYGPWKKGKSGEGSRRKCPRNEGGRV